MSSREVEVALKKKCIASASKYSSAEEWFINDFDCFEDARKGNILDDVIDFVIQDFTRPIWTFEMCKYAASKFYTWKSWEKFHNPTYYHARRNKFIDKCSEKISPSLLDSCLQKLKKYGSVSSWVKNDVSSYLIAYREGITIDVPEIKEYFENDLIWTKELCLEVSKQYCSRSDWAVGHSPSYNAARVNEWMDDCIAVKEVKKELSSKWTMKKCLEEAINYQTKEAWRKGSPESFAEARKRQWITICSEHMVITRRPKLEELIEDAKNYKSVQAWRLNSVSKYSMARNMGVLKECTSHMVMPKLTPMAKQIISHINKSFASVSEWKESDPSSYQYVVERDLLSFVKVPD